MLDVLTNTAKELLEIEDDFCLRTRKLDTPRLTNKYDLYVFPQTWGSTALGFDGCGGSMMTTANTYVLIPWNLKGFCFVYFGSRFAYSVVFSDQFWKDVKNHDMASVREAWKYQEKDCKPES